MIYAAATHSSSKAQSSDYSNLVAHRHLLRCASRLQRLMETYVSTPNLTSPISSTFGRPKYLSLLKAAPEGRHYSGVGGAGAVVILGGGCGGSSNLSFCSNRLSSASGSV